MASLANTRPSRRAAKRKSYAIEESSADENSSRATPTPTPSSHDNYGEEEEENDQDYTPVPRRVSSRRTSKRRTSGSVHEASHSASTTTTKPRRPRPSKQPEDIQPSIEEDEVGEASALAPETPTKKPSAPRKRSSVAPSRRSRMSSASTTATREASSLPTPAHSQTPEPQAQRKSPTPLADITQQAVNTTSQATQDAQTTETTETTENEKSNIDIINPNATVLEKPMDIVLKSRNLVPPPVEETTTPKNRLVISYLVLTNFKSYAGKQITGPFHVSFSSVVGPNGSGKSNVIDSLLFVFGFRASKMRQGKLSALIHNSAKFPNLPYCEVAVHFQEVMDTPEGEHHIVPNSELIVSRRAFRNNSSKYYLNGNETNFTAVTSLLRDRGIDLDHKRFLILQGEVESIAQMKAKAANEHDDGLLEYLEDIIGTSKYKAPIDEAAAEVENLNDVCVEKNNRVQHVEKEKNGLEDKKNKALAYIKDENELSEKQSALYQIYIEECNDNTRVTEEAILQMQELLNHELEKHQGSEDGIKQLQKAYKSGAKTYEAMEKETQAMVKEMAKYDKESVKFEEKRKFLLGKQKKLEKAMQSSRLSASECSSLVKKHTDDIERKTAEISTLEKEMQQEEKELSAIRESLKGKTQGLSDKISAKQKTLEPWNEKINEKQSAVAVAQSELDILREKNNAGAVALEEANAKIASIEEVLSGKSSDLEERRSEKIELEKEAARLNGDLQKLAQKEPEYRSVLSSSRQKAEEAKASLANTQNQGSVLAGLMRLKESGRIEGFHGRLGNLGTIDQKYDVAISTACPALENLVVDSVEVGQQCIDYLRKNNLGRANFILLDRLPRRDLSSIFTPDSVPRLFDLVKPIDPKFAPAFYSVLQNTLVAKNLEQANKIAYGARRWRVVTLDGQLIDVSGTMSGGGTRVAKGGMSSKPVAEVSKDQVAKLEYDRDEVEKKFQAFQEKQRDIESSLKSTNEQIPKLETAIQKIQLEIESTTRNLADSRKRVKEIAAEHKPSKNDDTRASSLEKHIASLENEIENFRAEMAGVEEEIQALQDRIMEVGGVKLRSQKARVDGLKEQIDLLTEEISNAEVSKSKNEKSGAKHEKSRVDSEEELENVKQELERLSEDVESQQSNVSESRQRTEEAQEVRTAIVEFCEVIANSFFSPLGTKCKERGTRSP